MNVRETTPDAQFSAFLSRFPPGIVALVERCLPKLRRAFPGATQIVYDYTKSLVVAFGMSDRGYEAIVAVAIFPDSVRLYLDKDLPDPKGLLQGAGSKVRSVTINNDSDFDRGAIHDLVKAAIRHSGVKFPPSGSNPMIIKSGSKKGAAKQGAARKGAAKQGAAKKGAAKQGAAKKGAAKKGAAKKGAAKQGAARKGAARKGAARKGAAKQGAAKKGAAKQGAAKKGAAKKGAAKKGAAKKGAAKKGAAKEVAAKKVAAKKSASP